MKDTLRLFVAAALPTTLQNYLERQLVHYQDPAVRLVPSRNLHLTLFFLGSTPQGALPELEEKIRQTALQHEPFLLTLQRLEPGPKPKSPRLIWARFEQSLPFEQLVRSLAQLLSSQSQKLQKAIPHITLARFRKHKAPPVALPTLFPQETISFPVVTVGLWKSELTSPHPEYSVLRNFPLGIT